jgi:hypothetical protein
MAIFIAAFMTTIFSGKNVCCFHSKILKKPGAIDSCITIYREKDLVDVCE